MVLAPERESYCDLGRECGFDTERDRVRDPWSGCQALDGFPRVLYAMWKESLPPGNGRLIRGIRNR